MEELNALCPPLLHYLFLVVSLKHFNTLHIFDGKIEFLLFLPTGRPNPSVL